MSELGESRSTRQFRLEVSYSAARLNALEETRHLAKDFEDAADKLRQLEDEEARLDIQSVETRAMVETADDAWDDVMRAFQRRLLDLSGDSQDHPLYRRYFADIPSKVTSMSYAAEILISRDLEALLREEQVAELASFADRLAEKRGPLEAALHERTRLEVEVAKFQNRVGLAKQLVNKLRRLTSASLEEIAVAKGRDRAWSTRFFHGHSAQLTVEPHDGSEPAASNGATKAAASEGAATQLSA